MLGEEIDINKALDYRRGMSFMDIEGFVYRVTMHPKAAIRILTSIKIIYVYLTLHFMEIQLYR
eukprot:snap_masked-scaffold_12-processed-gene-11.54-mRNA-1 protein AED:1.00 eAED:1.00 QI:0/0/0/0/1/1/3/0/62